MKHDFAFGICARQYLSICFVWFKMEIMKPRAAKLLFPFLTLGAENPALNPSPISLASASAQVVSKAANAVDEPSYD